MADRNEKFEHRLAMTIAIGTDVNYWYALKSIQNMERWEQDKLMQYEGVRKGSDLLLDMENPGIHSYVETFLRIIRIAYNQAAKYDRDGAERMVRYLLGYVKNNWGIYEIGGMSVELWVFYDDNPSEISP